MTRVRITGGFLNIASGGGHPDQGLPGGESPVDPGWGIEGGMPNHDLPIPPPGVWPPLTPTHPIQPAPGVPPGAIWPPVDGPPPRPGPPLHPDQGLPGEPPSPDQGLPGEPPSPDQGLPGQPPSPDQGLPSGTYWVVAGIPGVGWRYVCVDPAAVVPTPHRR